MDGSNQVYYSNRSAAYLMKGFKESALKDAEQCISMKPDWPKGYGRKGEALFALGRLPEALKAYEDGLKVDPSNQSLLNGKKDVEEAINRPSAPPGMDEGGFGGQMAQQLMAAIARNPKLQGYLKDPNFLNKLQLLKTNPQLALSDPQIMEVMQEMIKGMGADFAGAGSESGSTGSEGMGSDDNSSRFEEVPRAPEVKKEQPPPPPPEPKIPENETPEEKEKRENKEKATAKKDEGNKYYKSKDFEKALECYDAALEIDPDDQIYRVNKAAVYIEQKEYQKCIDECNKGIEIAREKHNSYETIAKLFFKLGNAFAKLEKYDEAIKAYKDSMVEAPLKQVKEKLLDVERLKAEKERLAYINPEKALEHKEKGNELMKEGKVPEAIKEYDEAIKRNPSDPILYCNRGAAYSKMMDYGRAMTDIEKSLELDPKYVKAWSRKGAIEYFLKKYHKAVESYQKGLDIDPNNEACKDGLEATMMKINENMRGGVDKEQQARALEDPEIQSILGDPIIQQVLQDMQQNPSSVQKHLSNPGIMEKIQKLIAAGILKMG